MAWKEESFIGNLNAAADALGYDNLDMAWALAGVVYDSAQDRDELLAELVGEAWPMIVRDTLAEETQ